MSTPDSETMETSKLAPILEFLRLLDSLEAETFWTTSLLELVSLLWSTLLWPLLLPGLIKLSPKNAWQTWKTRARRTTQEEPLKNLLKCPTWSWLALKLLANNTNRLLNCWIWWLCENPINVQNNKLWRSIFHLMFRAHLLFVKSHEVIFSSLFPKCAAKDAVIAYPIDYSFGFVDRKIPVQQKIAWARANFGNILSLNSINCPAIVSMTFILRAAHWKMENNTCEMGVSITSISYSPWKIRTATQFCGRFQVMRSCWRETIFCHFRSIKSAILNGKQGLYLFRKGNFRR